MSFEPITGEELRQRWLEHHEHVLRSSVHTVRRYRAATDHLLRFAQENKSLWWAMGAVREDRIRMEFIRVARRIGLPLLTMPKVLRHQFATALQDANTDPLIRNQLMGHMPAGFSRPGGGLGMTAVYTHSRPEEGDD